MTGRSLGLDQILFSLFGFQKVSGWKKRLLIVFIHIAGWLLLFMLPLFFYPFRISDSRFFLSQLFDKSLLVGFFYLNYYILIPKYFGAKKRSTYVLLVCLCFLLYLVPNYIIREMLGPPPMARFLVIDRHARPVSAEDSVRYNYLMERQKLLSGDSGIIPGNRPDGMFNPDDKAPPGMRAGMIIRLFSSLGSSFLLVLLMGGFIRLAFSFIRNQNEKKALENANLNAELNFLKSQINPHFLFNTLNGIYAQAHDRSDKTEHTVLKLSELLRYVIYDSGGDKVELEKDIQYITNYIDLQKIRLSSKVLINYEVTGDIRRYMIAPLLLISFIENAFKHGISYSRSSVIDISISVFDKTLTLSVRNPVIASDNFTDGGLGLKNVSRRLELLYPSDYSLQIEKTDQSYSVLLNLNLHHD